MTCSTCPKQWRCIVACDEVSDRLDAMEREMEETMFDVVAVNMKTNKVRFLAENKSERNAEAIENMAVMRRGLNEEFFATVPNGKYKEGDEYTGV